MAKQPGEQQAEVRDPSEPKKPENDDGHETETGTPPSPDIVHKNIDLANVYRLELSKTMLALAGALFAFTISFPPALMAIRDVWLLAAGWAALGISMIGGLANLFGWERFYISFRDYHSEYAKGKRARKRITIWRQLGRFAQVAGLVLGIAALAAFVVVNRANVKLAENKASEPATKTAAVVDQGNLSNGN